jgi:hypothetical protein
VVVEWHVSQGLMNDSGIARRDAYGTYGTPTAWFDGAVFEAGAGSEYARYRARIDERLALPPAVGLTAHVDFDGGGGTGTVVIDVSGLAAGRAGSLVARAIVYEDDVTYCCGVGGRDHWNHIGRLLTDAVALVPDGSGQATVEQTFALDPAWNPANLRAVALVHAPGALVVEAAARAAADPSPVDGTTWGRIKAAWR